MTRIIPFPGDGRLELNSRPRSVRRLVPRKSAGPSFHERWATHSSASHTSPAPSPSVSSPSPTQNFTTSAAAPGPPASSTNAPSLPTTSLPLTSSPVSHASVLTSTNTFMTTSLDPLSSSVPAGSSSSSSPSPTGVGSQLSATGNSVCLGHGLDASVDGLLATIVVSGALGLLLWLLFATIRPRFRQIYGLREWFVQESSRPKPLRPTFWAFLNPPVPMVPSISHDASDAGRSPADDARIFPSDEELSQRTLWHCLLMVLGWSVVGLAGALPLYIVGIPCIAETAPAPRLGGHYAVLQDLSVVRVLQLLDNRDVDTSVREIVNGHDLKWRARVRLIIVSGLLVVVGVLPALVKLLREYGKLLAFRRLWADLHLQGKEMGWISARTAPGFKGWGEKRLKDFILRTGLSSSLDFSAEPASSGVTMRGNGRSRRGPYMAPEQEYGLEVDIMRLWTVGDTQHLSLLIEERDMILEQLEIAETKYISSFRVSTPEPSIADLVPAPASDTEGIAHISRPRALVGSAANHRRRRGRNPADASSSLAPTSYVAPSGYYKLGIRGINGGRFTDDGSSRTSFTDSVNQRIVGTRFQEGAHESLPYGRLPVGSPLRMTSSGVLDVVHEPELELDAPIPDPRIHGPNYIERATEDTEPTTLVSPGAGGTMRLPSSNGDDDWVDIGREAPIDFRYSHTPSAGTPEPLPEPLPLPLPPLLPAADDTTHSEPARASSTFRFVRRPKIFGPTPSEHRSTFPLRDRLAGVGAGARAPGEEVPPHLRVQRAPPFVRPLTGFDHDELGTVYAEIRRWRSELKGINEEIAVQQDSGFQDIRDGVGIKGWLLVGRGIRYLPGVQMIEGRAKEDVRWDVLQMGGSEALGQVAFWTVVVAIGLALLVGLVAVAGLAVATTPDYAHYLPFMQGLASHNNFTTGLATVLAPSVAATLFITLALGLLHLSARHVATVSISAGQLLVIKAMFYMLVAVAVIGLITAGAILYAFGALSQGVRRTKTIADGSVYISIVVLAIVVNMAVAAPALLMLQPLRLRRVLRALKAASTPRQRFRATYPRTYNPLFAMSSCVLAVVFASTFSVVFPLLGPAVVLLVLLTLVAHRFLVGYVYGRTRSQTGGLLQIWLLKRFATLLALQPILLGLILLTRRLWPEGGALIGAGAFVVVFVEVYTRFKERRPSPAALSPVGQHAVETFRRAAQPDHPPALDEESTSLVSSGRGTRTRGSFASVLEMMTQRLAVPPSQYEQDGPVPIQTETLDDMTATERAARTHPDAPPRLPALSFGLHAESVSHVLFAPEFVAPPPVVWLPNDSAGVARAEAHDLQQYHAIRATIDVRSKDDVIQRRHPAL
ncbi:hypothetical protein BC834DRAFT_815275 [Gloeopeniophorella convolvens]|nr:hypothetical protein BC834DRAFT_815275 [Gloeopeniophorella convolvens]